MNQPPNMVAIAALLRQLSAPPRQGMPPAGGVPGASMMQNADALGENYPGMTPTVGLGTAAPPQQPQLQSPPPVTAGMDPNGSGQQGPPMGAALLRVASLLGTAPHQTPGVPTPMGRIPMPMRMSATPAPPMRGSSGVPPLGNLY